MDGGQARLEMSLSKVWHQSSEDELRVPVAVHSYHNLNYILGHKLNFVVNFILKVGAGAILSEFRVCSMCL